MNKLVTSYLSYLSKKGRSERTIRNYDFYLKRFQKWAKGKRIKSIDELTIEKVQDYRVWLKKIVDPVTKKKLKATTVNYHLIGLRNFLKYLNKKNKSAVNSKRIRLLKTEKLQAVTLNDEELQRMLSIPVNIKQDGLLQARDRAILEVLYCTGIKVSACASIEKEDLDFKKGVLTIDSKTMKLSNQASFWLKKYLKLRKDKVNYVFIGHDRAVNTRRITKEIRGLSPRSIERIVERYAKLAEVDKKVTPQVLRNTFTANLLKKGHDINKISEKLGHEKVTSTINYVIDNFDKR